jgi:hypothetical protein
MILVMPDPEACPGQALFRQSVKNRFHGIPKSAGMTMARYLALNQIFLCFETGSN